MYRAKESSRKAVVATFVGFVLMAFVLKVLMIRPALTPPLLLAIEILCYGCLYCAAIYYLYAYRHRDALRARMIVPTLLSAVVFLGCSVYAVLSRNDRSLHFVLVGTVIATLLLAKGLLGPLAAAISLSLAVYGYLHMGAQHVPIIVYVVDFVFGEVHPSLQYISTMVIAVGALANSIAAEGFEH